MVNRALSVLVAGAVMIGSSQLCLAVLGETEAELETRYGKPVATAENPKHSEPAEKVLYWRTEEGLVSAYMWRGRCVQETCVFVDHSGAKVPVKQNLKKAEAFLQTNAAGATWKSHPRLVDARMELVWSRSDGGAIAIVTTHLPSEVLVLDQTYTEARDALRGKR